MDELTRQSTAPVSSGRRRLNNIILGVAGVLVALLSGALIYLLYNQVSVCFRNSTRFFLMKRMTEIKI